MTVCRPCRGGADLLASRLSRAEAEALHVHELSEQDIKYDGGRHVAKWLHGRCKGKSWCDCQHRVSAEGQPSGT